jgi:hypothetical protein
MIYNRKIPSLSYWDAQVMGVSQGGPPSRGRVFATVVAWSIKIVSIFPNITRWVSMLLWHILLLGNPWITAPMMHTTIAKKISWEQALVRSLFNSSSNNCYLTIPHYVGIKIMNWMLRAGHQWRVQAKAKHRRYRRGTSLLWVDTAL